MTPIKFQAGLAGLALCLALSGCGSADPVPQASAASPSAANAIAARNANFKAIAGANKTIKTELEASSPNFAAISAAAGSIQTNAGKIVPLFPKGTGAESGEKTEALPAIWQRPADFKAAAGRLASAAGSLKAASTAKNLAASQKAAGEIGMACKGCHDQFREKK